jgi:hypothetical protein
VASINAVVAMLAVFAEYYPTRPVGKRTAQFYHEGLLDLSDEQIAAAVEIIRQQPGRTFFPTINEVRDTTRRKLAPVDIGKATRVIFALGHYSPHAGQQPPSVDVVRNNLGEAMAAAYAGVGAARLFSTNDTTREIAEREFGELLSEIPETQRALPAPRPFTFAAANRNGRLNGEPQRIGDVLKQLPGAPPHD